jgi:hypothetical protein
MPACLYIIMLSAIRRIINYWLQYDLIGVNNFLQESNIPEAITDITPQPLLSPRFTFCPFLNSTDTSCHLVQVTVSASVCCHSAVVGSFLHYHFRVVNNRVRHAYSRLVATVALVKSCLVLSYLILSCLTYLLTLIDN